MSKYVYLAFAFAFAFVLFVMVQTLAFQAQYKRGYEMAKAEMALEVAQQFAHKQDRVNTVAASYVAAQDDLRQKERARYERLSTITASAVYGRDCFDANGLQELNAAIK